jgi:hypothetical protein
VCIINILLLQIHKNPLLHRRRLLRFSLFNFLLSAIESRCSVEFAEALAGSALALFLSTQLGMGEVGSGATA